MTSSEPRAGATVHLVDASPYIFRAHFSLPSSIRDPAGRPVAATYGFIGFLARLIAEEEPSHLGVAFDGSLTTSFRNEIYPAYKAQREPPPAEIKAQIEDCRQAAEALGAVTWIDSRYEADDLIGTQTARLVTAGHRVVVVSSDKDLAQLVGERVALLDFAKGRRDDPADVEARFGVRPDQIVDLLALAGDAVDNIPGVRGIGPKSAVALLREMGDLDTLYERIEEVSELPLRGAASMRSKLEEGREPAFLSRRLATLSLEAPAAAELDELELEGADPALVDPLFERLGFERIRERVTRWK